MRLWASVSWFVRSLSVLLPVRNVQANLDCQVAHILEIAGDLAQRLELLIIDDGSSDHTVEVAHDLATRYPQVRVIRSGTQRGFRHAIEQGLARASGDVVLFHAGVSGEGQPALDDVRRLVNLAVHQRYGSWQTAQLHCDGWRAVAQEELALVRLRADQRTALKERRPNFLSKLRKLAMGE